MVDVDVETGIIEKKKLKYYYHVVIITLWVGGRIVS